MTENENIEGLENDDIKTFVETKGKKCSKGQITEELKQIYNATKNIEGLGEKAKSAETEGPMRLELEKILEVLPQEVDVLYLSKKIRVFREKENNEDKLIRIWWEKDLKEYTSELSKLLAPKGSPVHMGLQRWE
jgi:hypothetical protein